MRIISKLLAAFIIGMMPTGSGLALAQQISGALVRGASTPKTSVSNDMRTFTKALPARVWTEGDPVIVKDDLKQNASEPTSLGQRQKQRDRLIPELTRSLQLSSMDASRTPVVITNFDGIGATGYLPPDTVGAAGPHHYIQMVNTEFAIFDKNGTPLAGPVKINSLWKGFGGACETSNEGDPVVRYDHLADRWLLSQFALDEHMQCIAVSRGSDPVTSGWNLYAFRTLDAAGNEVDSDYPKIGLWADGLEERSSAPEQAC